MTADWERDGGELEDRESFGYLQKKREEDRRRDEEMFGRLSYQFRVVSKSISEMAPLVDLLSRGVTRASEDNQFDEVRGGSSIVSASERIKVMFDCAVISLKKAKLDMEGFKDDEKSFADAVADLAKMKYIDREFGIKTVSGLYRIPLYAVRCMVDREVRANELIDGRAAQGVLALPDQQNDQSVPLI